MTQTSICLSPKCRKTAEGDVARCPDCGKRMRTPRGVRRAGWVLVFLGAFLILFMGWITLAMAPLLLDAGVQGAGGNTFTGSAGEGQMILGLFGTVIVFSLATVFAGVGQIRTGARDPRVVKAMVGLFAVLIIFALLTKFVLKG